MMRIAASLEGSVDLACARSAAAGIRSKDIKLAGAPGFEPGNGKINIWPFPQQYQWFF
jgi:hypothetical protein